MTLRFLPGVGILGVGFSLPASAVPTSNRGEFDYCAAHGGEVIEQPPDSNVEICCSGTICVMCTKGEDDCSYIDIDASRPVKPTAKPPLLATPPPSKAR